MIVGVKENRVASRINGQFCHHKGARPQEEETPTTQKLDNHTGRYIYSPFYLAFRLKTTSFQVEVKKRSQSYWLFWTASPAEL
ncbi:hypothetical protein BOTCAL_0276g00090 [Botryotinia calthae]|uniref:Uncharacterized protein n=1 Tax=Botryotinia calthae TaxID=38488 RepID=A0A4Y8CW36_9HELO|nr:hypothetical protein BOTCAL_0276g00090 [Botryotinia calthae]